jgi:hypothetical protein
MALGIYTLVVLMPSESEMEWKQLSKPGDEPGFLVWKNEWANYRGHRGESNTPP